MPPHLNKKLEFIDEIDEKIQEKTTESPRRLLLKKIWKFLRPLVSLALTIFLFILLFEDINLYQTTQNPDYIVAIILEALGVFGIPCILNPRIVTDRVSKQRKKKRQEELKKLENQIRRKVKLNAHYAPALVTVCPRCGFENPSFAKICLNCGNKLSF
ncbi:MAG: hypothetical protein ACTSVU_06845 [Promethearchaeota archaeon]